MAGEALNEIIAYVLFETLSIDLATVDRDKRIPLASGDSSGDAERKLIVTETIYFDHHLLN